MGYDPNYRRGWAQDFEDLHADALTGDTRRAVRSLPASLRSARHDLAIMPPEDVVDALIGLQDLAAMLAADLATANKQATEARAALKQVQDDGRLMLAELVRLDESEGTNTLGCWRDAGLSDAEQEALSVLVFQPSPEGADDLATVRRILAAGGAR